MKTLKYPLLILVFPLATAHAAPDCMRAYTELAQGKSDRVRDRYRVRKYGDSTLIEQLRDWTRDQIIYLKKRAYPIMAMDDATPLKANLLAKSAIGNKAALEGAPFSASQIKSEMEEMLKLVERYPADFNAFLEDTAMKQARLAAMEKALEEGLPRSHNITLKVPVTKMDDKGNLVEVSMKEISWGTRTKFDLELKALKKDLEKRENGPRFWQGKQEAYTLEATTEAGEPIVFDAMEHIHRVKKLETYLAEYRDALSRAAARKEPVAVDPELQPLYDRIADFYQPGSDKLKDALHAPYWAWQRLRWEQINAELKTIILKDRIDLADNETTKAVVNYLKNLDPEERRALGIDKLAASVSLFGKNIYVRTLVGIGSSVVGTGGAVTKGLDILSQLRNETIQKETCASATSDSKFRACVQDYLQSKFTVAAIKTIVFGNESFLDDTSKIKDPAVRREVEDIISRRKTYVGSEIQKKENADALDKAIKDVQGTQDPGSDAFREKMITAPRPEIFVFGIAGDADNKTIMYLGFQHPGQFKKNRDLVLQILSEADADKRKTMLTQLKEKGAADLAEDLDGLISDREEYLADPDRYLKRGGSRKKTKVTPAKTVDSDKTDKADKNDKSDKADKSDKSDDEKENDKPAKKKDAKSNSDERDDSN